MASETGKITDKTACILCSRNCGLAVTIDDGKFTRIRGDEAHPVSRGYICQKAARLEHYQHHADRLRDPLKRQPGGSFVRVSWDEALTDIARRLTAIREQHGGSAFAFYGGGGQGNHLGGMYSQQLSRLAEREQRLHDAMAEAAADHQRALELNRELRAVVDEREGLELEWLEAAELVS